MSAIVTKLPLYCIGDIVRHKHFSFRGVIVDVDPEFDGTDEWYDSILKMCAQKEQPFYHLLAENLIVITLPASASEFSALLKTALFLIQMWIWCSKD